MEKFLAGERNILTFDECGEHISVSCCIIYSCILDKLLTQGKGLSFISVDKGNICFLFLRKISFQSPNVSCVCAKSPSMGCTFCLIKLYTLLFWAISRLNDLEIILVLSTATTIKNIKFLNSFRSKKPFE